jgi:DNA-binding response OmpR family regulator
MQVNVGWPNESQVWRKNMSYDNLDLSLVSKKMGNVSENIEDRPYSILIVEDDLGLSTVLNRIIRKVHPNFKIEWVTTVTEALRELKRPQADGGKSYDLILSDILLSDLELGTDLWRYCRIHCPNTPFVMMSGVDPETYFRMIGPEGSLPYFLPKPFSVEDCKTTIELLLLGQSSSFSCS